MRYELNFQVELLIDVRYYQFSALTPNCINLLLTYSLKVSNFYSSCNTGYEILLAIFSPHSGGHLDLNLCYKRLKMASNILLPVSQYEKEQIVGLVTKSKR